MGTVVFPDATAKIFLTASPEIRAERRYNQLKDTNKDVSLASFIQQVKERDTRDINRKFSPMIAAKDAFVIDSSKMTIDEVLQIGLKIAKNNGI
jgi:cytidylate kinase